jgi:hypothetical protein
MWYRLDVVKDSTTIAVNDVEIEIQSAKLEYNGQEYTPVNVEYGFPNGSPQWGVLMLIMILLDTLKISRLLHGPSRMSFQLGPRQP